MSTFVLVHAAAFAGWSWFKIVPRLERRGHKVIARDLPGHGRDRMQLSEITFECLVDSVCAIVDEQAEPVILVGHSWGGGIITQAAEHRSDRIGALVYLAGVLPKNGQSIMDCLALPEAEESLAPGAVEPSATEATCRYGSSWSARTTAPTARTRTGPSSNA
jgi:pimeloyl-ACP methyl ester carboxylesterase